MRVATLAPVVSLIGGIASGLALSELFVQPMALALLWLGLSAVCAGMRGAWARVVVAGVAVAFVGGGGLLAVHAVQGALRPPLRQAFDDTVASGDAEGLQAIVTGALATDAAVGDESVVLELDVTAIRILARGSARHSAWMEDRGVRAARGGVRIAVAGELAAAAAHHWRAGRTVAMPTWLRRPTTYRNAGALDEERALARRGITLIGSVKSAALADAAGDPARGGCGGCPLDHHTAGGRDLDRRSRSHRAPSNAARLGASGSAEQRFDRDRAALARRVDRSAW